jgi:hypothetical protein
MQFRTMSSELCQAWVALTQVHKINSYELNRGQKAVVHDKASTYRGKNIAHSPPQPTASVWNSDIHAKLTKCNIPC